MGAARAESERMRIEAADRAREEAERETAEIRARAQLELQAAERQVQDMALDVSGRILDRVVTLIFTDEERAHIVARGLEQIKVLR